MGTIMAENFDMIQKLYEGLSGKLAKAREVLGRPMTYAEKILYSHLWNEPAKEFKRGNDYVDLSPDRVAMQDATAQMALLQFMHSGRDKVSVPSTAHADHLIQAKVGAEQDLIRANDENREVYDFISSVSKKYGIGLCSISGCSLSVPIVTLYNSFGASVGSVNTRFTVSEA